MAARRRAGIPPLPPGLPRGYPAAVKEGISPAEALRCVLEETRVLQRLGHKVTIATYRNGNDVDGLAIERTLPIPWRREYEVGSSRHKLVFDALLGLKTLGLLLRRRVACTAWSVVCR